MKILGLTGKKGSGKNTCANYLFGTVMVNLGLCESMTINKTGQLVVPFQKEEGGEIEDIIVDPLSSNLETQRFFEESVWPWCKIYSFADPLKAICCQILGLSPKQCYGDNDDKNTFTKYQWQDMPHVVPKDFEDKWGNVADDYGLNVKDSGQMTAREIMQYVGTEIFRKMNSDIWVNATVNRIQKEEPQLAIICDIRFPNEVEAIQKADGKVIKLLRNPNKDNDQHEKTIILMQLLIIHILTLIKTMNK